MLVLLGFICLIVGGGMLHDVPFPRFIAAVILFGLGQSLLNAGFQ